MMDSTAPSTEAELERFREQWRAEVARSQKSEKISRSTEEPSKQQRQKEGAFAPAVGPSTARRKDLFAFSDNLEPSEVYHDLPDKEEDHKLGVEGQNHERVAAEQPVSALEHYERAVDKEAQGQLGDSVKHYRKALKVCLTLFPMCTHDMC